MMNTANTALAVLALASGAAAQLGIPSVCPYPVTWEMSKSTIIMRKLPQPHCAASRLRARASSAAPPSPPRCWMTRGAGCAACNESGLTDPLSTVGWGIVDFDWSNAKTVWAAAKPMNCEEMLVEQVLLYFSRPSFG